MDLVKERSPPVLAKICNNATDSKEHQHFNIILDMHSLYKSVWQTTKNENGYSTFQRSRNITRNEYYVI
jgi:hypothetical protein